MFSSFASLVDRLEFAWSKAYSDTEDAQIEKYNDLFRDSNSPMDLQASYLGERWHSKQETISGVANTGFEIYCLCQDITANMEGKPECNDYIRVTMANLAIQQFGIIDSPETLDNILHTLLLTDLDLDPTNPNYCPLFARFDTRVAAVAIKYFYFLLIAFEAESCKTIWDWIVLLVDTINENYNRAEKNGTSLHNWGGGKYQPVSLQRKRYFAPGELPTYDWKPEKSYQHFQNYNEFLFLKAREDIPFNEKMHRQRPNAKITYGAGFESKHYMTN
jgi:hypothetical protein